MEFLGISGVRDVLQDNVAKTIVCIKEANLKFWLLTGDKLETAMHICRGTGLIKRGKDFEIMDNNMSDM